MLSLIKDQLVGNPRLRDRRGEDMGSPDTTRNTETKGDGLCPLKSKQFVNPKTLQL